MEGVLSKRTHKFPQHFHARYFHLRGHLLQWSPSKQERNTISGPNRLVLKAPDQATKRAWLALLQVWDGQPTGSDEIEIAEQVCIAICACLKHVSHIGVDEQEYEHCMEMLSDPELFLMTQHSDSVTKLVSCLMITGSRVLAELPKSSEMLYPSTLLGAAAALLLALPCTLLTQEFEQEILHCTDIVSLQSVLELLPERNHRIIVCLTKLYATLRHDESSSSIMNANDLLGCFAPALVKHHLQDRTKLPRLFRLMNGGGVDENAKRTNRSMMNAPYSVSLKDDQPLYANTLQRFQSALVATAESPHEDTPNEAAEAGGADIHRKGSGIEEDLEENGLKDEPNGSSSIEPTARTGISNSDESVNDESEAKGDDLEESLSVNASSYVVSSSDHNVSITGDLPISFISHRHRHRMHSLDSDISSDPSASVVSFDAISDVTETDEEAAAASVMMTKEKDQDQAHDEQASGNDASEDEYSSEQLGEANYSLVETPKPKTVAPPRPINYRFSTKNTNTEGGLLTHPKKAIEKADPPSSINTRPIKAGRVRLSASLIPYPVFPGSRQLSKEHPAKRNTRSKTTTSGSWYGRLLGFTSGPSSNDATTTNRKTPSLSNEFEAVFFMSEHLERKRSRRRSAAAKSSGATSTRSSASFHKNMYQQMNFMSSLDEVHIPNVLQFATPQLAMDRSDRTLARARVWTAAHPAPPRQ